MADQELQQLLDRITAARDFAHNRARKSFAAMDDPASTTPGLLLAQRAAINRAVAQVLNVVLGLHPNDGDDYTELYPPEPPADQE